MAAGTAVGSILAGIGTTAAKVGSAIGTTAAKIMPGVAKAAAAGGKTFGGQLLKMAPKALADVASVAIPLASTGFSFAQARQSGEQIKEGQAARDEAFQQTMDSLNRDRFANVSYSTRGLERGMDTATAIASNLISRRSDQGGRGVYGGGRDLQQVQDFMQRAAVTFDDKATNLALNKAMAAQRADEKMADVQLKNLIGLQNELQANRNLQSAYLGSGIQGLTSALAGLQSVAPDFGDPEELIEDIVEDNNTQNSFGSGGGGVGYTQSGGLV